MGATVEWSRFDVIDSWRSKGVKIFLGMIQIYHTLEIMIILYIMGRIYIYDNNSFKSKIELLKYHYLLITFLLFILYFFAVYCISTTLRFFQMGWDIVHLR